jgi:nitroreductase
MKTVMEAITDRRSINFFDTNRIVPNEDLEKLLNIAALSPSANNTQPWEVFTVVSPEMKKKLRAASMNQAKVEEASAVFVIAEDPKRAGQFAKIAPSLFAMTLMLAAQDMGYQTHPMGGFYEDQVKQVLDIPQDYTVILMVCIGFLKPDVTLRPRADRRTAAEFNRFV